MEEKESFLELFGVKLKDFGGTPSKSWIYLTMHKVYINTAMKLAYKEDRDALRSLIKKNNKTINTY